MSALQKTETVSDAWGGVGVTVTVFGCVPDHKQECLRDRATVQLSSGGFGLAMRATRAELLAMAELLREAAETIPEVIS